MDGMSIFVENDHPRALNGRWEQKHNSAPLADLVEPSPETRFCDWCGELTAPAQARCFDCTPEDERLAEFDAMIADHEATAMHRVHDGDHCGIEDSAAPF